MSGIVGLLQFAADGVSQQQQATANNLANSETPGFTGQDVDFESSLQNAIDAANGGTATISVTPDPAAVSSNGNNVDTSTQLVNAETETLQYQTVIEMLNSQFSLISDAAGGGSSS